MIIRLEGVSWTNWKTQVTKEIDSLDSGIYNHEVHWQRKNSCWRVKSQRFSDFGIKKVLKNKALFLCFHFINKFCPSVKCTRHILLLLTPTQTSFFCHIILMWWCYPCMWLVSTTRFDIRCKIQKQLTVYGKQPPLCIQWGGLLDY